MATLNCRGLKKMLSTTDGKHYARIIRSLQYDILCLQETHVNTPAMKVPLQRMLQAHSTAWTSHCGVVCFNRQFVIQHTQSLFHDRLLIVTLAHSQQLCDDITLYIVYGPATHIARQPFYQQLHTFMQDQPVQRSILLGDFNYNIHRQVVQNFPEEWNNWLLSSWHDPIHDDPSTSNVATFRPAGSTIDFLLCSPDLQHHMHHPQITYVDHTDHHAVSIKLTTGIPKLGPGLWRFNPALIKSEYIRNEINLWLDTACGYLPPTTIQEQWDWLKLHLRAFCQTLSCKAASYRQRQLQYLQKEYRRLLKEARHMGYTALRSQLSHIQRDMARIQNEEADTQMLRAGIQWREKGERSNSYFYKCLKQRQVKQYIHALKTDDGSLVTDQNDMAQCARDFYSNLYRAENIDRSALQSLLDAIPHDVGLDDDDGQLLLEPWTDDEILNGLSRSPHQSSPGMDGFPYELLKFIYHHPRVKSLLTQVFNEALISHKTPASWRKSVVTLLPKQGDRTSLRNWRPISLICTDAKVFTRMLSTRISPLMSKLINPYQTGFLHDRFIADNGLLARLVMSVAQKYDITGAALLLDQEKAYDRVHPEYLKAVLQQFRFPASLINSIMHLFFDTQLSININGFISTPCAQQRGLRQGDPLSPLLFNLMLEPLLRSILSATSIRGFSFDIPHSPLFNTPFAPMPAPLKTLAYADDVLIFVTDKEEIHDIMTNINLYCRASNAKLNCQKTLVVSLTGAVPDDWRHVFDSHDLRLWHDHTSTEAATYLGFPLNSTQAQLTSFLQSRLAKLKADIHTLQSRSLSIRGKALVANSLLLSRMWYCLRILPLSQQFINSIQSAIIQYLQGGTLPKVSFMTCCRPKKEGGLGVLHPMHHLNALQLRWIQPLLSNDPEERQNSLADPYLRLCIHAFCSTLSPTIPILFPERRDSTLLSLGHFKSLFQACDSIKLKVNWKAVTHFTVLAIPLIKICTFAGPANATPKPSWRTLLVQDAFILSTRSHQQHLRERTSRERTRHTRKVNAFHRDIQPNGTWRLKPFFKRLLETLPSGEAHRTVSIDYLALVAPITHMNIRITDLTRKALRYSLLPPLVSLPPHYPRGTHSAWHRFWNGSIPQQACTIRWRLLHHKISSRQRLHALIPQHIESPNCQRCTDNPDVNDPAVESDQHFFFSCPSIQSVWHHISRLFFAHQHAIQWRHISSITTRPPSVSSNLPLSFDIIIACGLLAIWRAHWRYVYHQEAIPCNIIAESATNHINRIISEYRLVNSESL